MLKISGVQQDSIGKIIGYKLNDGSIINQDDAIKMVKEGRINGAIAGVNENGEKVLHQIPDNREIDNIYG